MALVHANPYTPHDYQKEAIKFMVSQGAAGLFLDPGLGKTSITLAAFKILKAKGLVKKALVIAPLRPVFSVWPAERTKWDDFKDIKMAILHGENKSSLYDKNIDIHLINPEGLFWLLGNREHPGAIDKCDWFWDMLVVDESTKFKHTNSLRSKLLRRRVEEFKRRYILTGSPAPNGLMDLFGQMYLIDQGASLGRFITQYRREHFDQTGFGGYTYVLKPGHETKIQDKIRPLVMRLEAKDYLDLPPLIENTIKVDLPDDAREVYEDMKEALVAMVASGMVTAANASVAAGKCRQIANGGIYHDDETPTGARLVTQIHDAKTDAVESIIDELGGKPALVAFEYKHDLARLLERFPGAPVLGGGVKPEAQAQIEADWNAGRIPVLLAQPQSVAHGLNLQGVGAAVIWHSLPWDLELYEQFIRRVWRQGQTERVVVHHIVARKTVDEAVMRAIKLKDMTQRGLLDALKSQLKGRGI